MTEQIPGHSEPVDPLHSLRGSSYRVALFTVIVITVLISTLYVVMRIRHVLELFTIAFLLAMAINPIVSYLERRHVRRWISVLLLLVLVFTGVGIGLWLLGPKLVSQAADFVQNAPRYADGLKGQMERYQSRIPGLENVEIMDRLQEQIQARITDLWGALSSFFTASATALFETILVVFIIVFLVLDPHTLVSGLRGLLPAAWHPEADRIGALAVGKVEAWIQGSLLLMLTIGVAITIGLVALDVPYALLWGVLSGLLEIIPTIGPIISAVPPLLVGLSINPMLGLYVVILYVVVQQLESNILVPVIMANKVRLHPITLLFFLLVMTEFLGIFGALIATPAAAVLKVLYLELYYRRLHGDIPAEEKDDPIRERWLRKFARRAKVGEPPGPARAEGE